MLHSSAAPKSVVLEQYDEPPVGSVKDHSILHGKHRAHTAFTITSNATMVKPMVAGIRNHEEKPICSKTVRKFPEFIRWSDSATSVRKCECRKIDLASSKT